MRIKTSALRLLLVGALSPTTQGYDGYFMCVLLTDQTASLISIHPRHSKVKQNN